MKNQDENTRINGPVDDSTHIVNNSGDESTRIVNPSNDDTTQILGGPGSDDSTQILGGPGTDDSTQIVGGGMPPHNPYGNSPQYPQGPGGKKPKKSNQTVAMIAGALIVVGVIICMIVGIILHNAEEKREQERIADSIRIAQELERQEQERLEQLRLDSIRIAEARLDSIRRDSISKEEEMRIDPMIFARGNYDGSYRKKLLNRYGFKVVYDREFMNYDIDEVDGMEDYEIRYTRTFNGRKIVFDEWGTTCMGASLKFYNKIDKDNFIEDIKKAGYKKTEYGYERDNPWHVITFEGNVAYVIDCS